MKGLHVYDERDRYDDYLRRLDARAVLEAQVES